MVNGPIQEPELIAKLSLLFSVVSLEQQQRRLEPQCAKRRQASERSPKAMRKRRQTLHFFAGTPLNSSPSSSLMFLSLSLLLLLLPLSPLDRQWSLCIGRASANEHSASGTSLSAPSSSALVANSIFDAILGRTTTSNEVNPNISAGASSNSDSSTNGNSNNHYYTSGSRSSSGSRKSQADRNSNENSAAQPDSNQLASQAAAAAADLHQSYKNGQTSDKVTLPGDILLGGLFPIHMKGAKVECGEINRDRGIQRLEAMLYALDKINEDQRLLPDIKLGAILLDSCSSSTYALNQSLEFIRASINTVEASAFECKDKSAPRPKYGSKMIAGVIGGSYSEVSLQVANLLRLFRIPQVSYASTGTALSDKTLYDLFARTVPSDMFQARAIADIVLKLNWSYVSLVSSEGLYGDSGSKEFMKQASVRRICIATHEKVSPTADIMAYDSIIANLLKRNATGVVLFTRAEDTRELLLAVKRAHLFHNFAWVAADGWGTHQKLVEGVEEVALGAITVELQAKAIPGFDQYMKALTPWQNGRNPWFSEYWQEWFDCQLQQNLLQQQQLASGSYASALSPSSSSSSVAASVRRGSDEGAWSSSSEFLDLEANNPDYGDAAGARAAAAAAAYRRRRSNGSGPSKLSNHTPEVKLTPQTGKRAEAEAEAHTIGRSKRSPGLVSQSTKEMKQFCSPNLRISESNGYRQEQKVQFVVDAVYAMAHALHRAWANLCDAQPGVVCEALKELNGGDFYSKYLLNVSFKDLAGSEVKFDEHGDGLGRYNIYNFRKVRPQLAEAANYSAPPVAATSLDIDQLDETTNFGMDPLKQSSGGEYTAAQDRMPAGPQSNSAGAAGFSSDQVEHIYTSNVEFEYSTVGRWTESDYFLKLNDIQFIQGDSLIPESYCSRPCELGQAKIMRAGDHCCWICKTCAPYEFLPDEFSCKDCGIGRWPVQNKTSCFDLPQKYLRWDSIYSLISLTIACLGIALTLFVSVIFIKYLDTPVVKASGRELSFILLAGIAFCHLSTFVLLAKPTTFICGSQRFLVNFGFSLMYASLLVKTNRISRIFNCARKSAKRPSFISPRSQMLITGILVAIQIFLTIVWFVFEPPGIRADSPEGKRDEVILKCRAKGKSFIISLVYNMILITTCTIYAVKTRKIPENFNESKFIGFTMYTTIVIWLAFVTMFFGTNNSYEIQINTMCVCISLSAYVTLFCLFSPKVSIILLHPDKNVRKLTMNSATYKRPFKQMSSHASIEGGKNGGMNTYSMGPGGTQGGYTTTGSGAYMGAGQADGPSGGPMSTTSNMLNPVDSQAASRLQESSIVSNVVNSNSAGSQSNCSQSKTPTTLSQQQLVPVATCANCGAHQLTQQQQPLANDQTAATVHSSGRQVKVGSGRSAAPPSNQQIARSSILVPASSARAGSQQQQQQAKVLHSSRGKAADDSKLGPAADAGGHSSCALAGASGRALLMKKRQMASLSELNEIQPDGCIANRGQHNRSCVAVADESSSSLANDSFNLLNTSQENTPCSMPIGHAISKQRRTMGAAPNAANALAADGELAGCDHYKGSDSMLWNQSDYSIDYCSDCCPSSSYCHCSCPACLSGSNGAAMDDSAAIQQAGLTCVRNASANNVHSGTASFGGACHRVGGSVDYIYQMNPDELENEEALVDNELDRRLMVHDGDGDNDNDDDNEDYDIMCDHHTMRRSHNHHRREFNDGGGASKSRVARIRRRKSEEPTRPYRTMDLEEPSAEVHSMAPIRQHRDSLTSSAQQHNRRQTTGASNDNAKSRSQTMEMRTMHVRDADSSSQGSGEGGHDLRQRPSSSIAFALQTAALPALGATGAQAIGAVQKSSTELPQRKLITSIKDKPSEKTAVAQQQSVSLSTATTAAGPIQASIELAKQVSHQMQQQQLWNRKASTSYHDDYEYSYGLVQEPLPQNEDNFDERHLLADDGDTGGLGRAIKLTTSVGSQLALGHKILKGSSSNKYEIAATHSEGPGHGNELGLYHRNDDANRDDDFFHDDDDNNNDDDDDANDADDFEHDGRLSLNRTSIGSGSTASKGSKRHSGSRPIRAKQAKSRPTTVRQQSDGHRINSVALIEATLSAGGAIVESGSSSSKPNSLDTSSSQR